MSVKFGTRENFRFFYRVFLPIILAVFTTFVSLGAFMIWATSRSDEASVSREMKLVSHILDQQQDLVKLEQKDVVAWDMALAAVQGELDIDWIEEYLGKGMYEFYGHDRAWVLGPNLQPVYAMQDGKTVDISTYENSRATLEPTARRLREINWQGALSSFIYGHNDNIPSIVDIALIDGMPAIVSQMTIASGTRVGDQAPGLEYIHITAGEF